MEKEVTKDIITENGESEFEVRVIRDEGVGVLTSDTGKSYLILDSLDYWFDVIQDGYPAKKKCKCKNDRFKAQFVYTYREHYEDIKHVDVITTCTQCGKEMEVLDIDIDYSPTNQLLEKPITFCEKPKIKYKLTQLTGYWNDNEMADMLRFMADELKLNIYGWFFDFDKQLRHFEKLTLNEAIEQVKKQFLKLYITAEELDMESYIWTTNDKGVYLKNDMWRKDEIIEVSGINMYEIGVLYYIEFGNEYLEKGDVKSKSDQFSKITSRLIDWLKEHYTSKRGKNCFDGEEGYQKYLAKK